MLEMKTLVNTTFQTSWKLAGLKGSQQEEKKGSKILGCLQNKIWELATVCFLASMLRGRGPICHWNCGVGGRMQTSCSSAWDDLLPKKMFSWPWGPVYTVFSPTCIRLGGWKPTDRIQYHHMQNFSQLHRSGIDTVKWSMLVSEGR